MVCFWNNHNDEILWSDDKQHWCIFLPLSYTYKLFSKLRIDFSLQQFLVLEIKKEIYEKLLWIRVRKLKISLNLLARSLCKHRQLPVNIWNQSAPMPVNLWNQYAPINRKFLKSVFSVYVIFEISPIPCP